MKFRKKPVVIDAVLWDGTNISEVREFFGGFSDWTLSPPNAPVGGLNIVTLEGTHRADTGDWILKGVKGEFYPCKSDIFEATYDPA